MESTRRLTIFLIVALPISVWDLACRRIPDHLVAAGLLLQTANCLLSPTELPSAVAGAASGFALLWALRRLVRRGMGLGDVKFAGFVGSIVGVRDLCLALFVASAAALVVALAARFVNRDGQSGKIPFAPFLTLGGLTPLLAPHLDWAGFAVGGMQ